MSDFFYRHSLIAMASLMLTVLISACSSRNTVEQEAFGMIETFQVDKSSGLKDGAFKRHTKEGVLVEEATYDKGMLDGTRILYYPNGNKEIIETYSKDTLNGSYTTFYEFGQQDVVGVYFDGVMRGIWKRYYENGQLMEEVTFEDNLENGPFTEYHSNGKLKAEGQFYHGDNEQGLLTLYDNQGELLRKMECDSGICVTVWVRPDATEAQPIDEEKAENE